MLILFTSISKCKMQNSIQNNAILGIKRDNLHQVYGRKFTASIREKIYSKYTGENLQQIYGREFTANIKVSFGQSREIWVLILGVIISWGCWFTPSRFHSVQCTVSPRPWRHFFNVSTVVESTLVVQWVVRSILPHWALMSARGRAHT